MTLYLIIGNCGVGKTWLMKQLMKVLDISSIYSYKTGLYTYLKKNGIILLGKYDNSVFEGSDRLSMSIMTDNEKIHPILETANYVVAEGDRFTNSTFIKAFNPIILRINGTGEAGRIKRNSNQTQRHLKSIATRVSNIKPNYEFENNEACLQFLITQINANKEKESCS